jgi:hypothetical protein
MRPRRAHTDSPMLNGAASAAWRILTAPAHVSVKRFRTVFAAERDNVYWRGFALWWFGRGFFVGRVCPARVIGHAKPIHNSAMRISPISHHPTVALFGITP